MQGIKNKNWLVRRVPFNHMVVRDIFEDTIVQRLTSNFQNEVAKRRQQKSNIRNYDAAVIPLSESDRELFNPLLSVEWLRLISRAMNLQTTLEVDGALHAHPPGSRSGWIHNDYNPGWFARAAEGDQIVFSSSSGINYRTGRTEGTAAAPICRIRFLTLIYYLGNVPWTSATGGETGIYQTQKQSVDRADVWVPPENNTLLLFECTPHSWHSFRSSSVARHSITYWLHRDIHQAKQQWPHHEPVYWT